MGQSYLSVAIVALTLVASASGQGVVYREAWGYMHLEERRHELASALTSATSERREAVAKLLGEPDGGLPIVPLANAMAAVRGVEADPPFVLRTLVASYVLPEVVDPDGNHPSCRDVAVTAFLPFPMPLPGALSFAVEVDDAAGKTVFRGAIERDTSLDDLRSARPALTVPGKELPDGRYRMRLVTRIDGEGPRATDPQLAWTFHVLRGYQHRAEAAMGGARDLAPRLARAEREVLTGLSSAVLRAYTGEAFVGASDAVAELRRLEAAVRVGAGAEAASEPRFVPPPERCVPLWLEIGDAEPLRCWLQRATERERPLVVVVSGSPAYDATLRRPAGPAVRDPAWTRRELGDFGSGDDWHVACVQSPGDGRNFVGSLTKALPRLIEHAGSGGQPVALVCEREAAAAVALQLPQLAPRPAAIVLIGSGGMPAATLEALGATPVRVVRLAGYPGSDGLQRIREYLAVRPTTTPLDLDWLVPQELPWPSALPLVREPLRAFLAGALPK
jgi:hypothetical protein